MTMSRLVRLFKKGPGLRPTEACVICGEPFGDMVHEITHEGSRHLYCQPTAAAPAWQRYQVKLTLNVEAGSRGDVIDAVVREVKVARVQVSVADAAFEIVEMGNDDVEE